MYDIQLWGCAVNQKQTIIQRSQSNILSMMADAPWYVSNLTLYEYIKIPFTQDVIKEQGTRHHQRLESHSNPLLHHLLEHQADRRLKRKWPTDLRND